MEQSQALAEHLRSIRLAQDLTLQELAGRSGISRATLSRIENGEVSPTAETLGRLAIVFALPISQLLAPLEAEFPALVRRDQQSVWVDPDHGFIRRNVSPPSQRLRMEMIEGTISPNQRIAYEREALPDLEHHLLLLSGSLFLTIGAERHELAPGDCLRYRLAGSSCFETGDQEARYLLAMG
jgi:transcriptional regulator with XRE-family HTH domain